MGCSCSLRHKVLEEHLDSHQMSFTPFGASVTPSSSSSPLAPFTQLIIDLSILGTTPRMERASAVPPASYPTPSSLGCFGCSPAAISTASDSGIVVLHSIEVNNLSHPLPPPPPYRGGHCTLPRTLRALLSASSRRVGRSLAMPSAHRKPGPACVRGSGAPCQQRIPR